MRILTTLLLTLATVLPCFGATTWPAATNAPNTFFQTNRFLKQVTFGNPATNIIADSGSSINGVGFTNNTVYGDGSGLTGIPLGALPAGVLTNNYVTAVTFNDDLTLGTAASDLTVGGTATFKDKVTLTNCSLLVTGANYIALSNNTARVLLTNGAITASDALTAYSLTASSGGIVAPSGQAIGWSGKAAQFSTTAGRINLCNSSSGGPLTNLTFNLITSGGTNVMIRTTPGTLPTISFLNDTNGPEAVTVSDALTATNGLYYFPQTNGLVQAMTNLTPVHAWGCMMSWGTNLINGGAGTYAVVTNNPSFCTARTNAFGANIAGGVLTNLIAGFYRVAIHLSGVAVDNSAVVEGDLLLNNVVRDEVSFITAFDNPPRIKGMSAFGRLYITNNTPITFQIKSSGANGVTVYRAQVDVGP